MNTLNIHSTSKGVRASVLVLMLLAVFFAFSLSTATSAAAACPKGQMCDGTGETGTPPPAGGTPTPGPPGGNNGGGTAPVDPYGYTIWNPGGGAFCGIRDDGKAALGYFTHYTTIFNNTTDGYQVDTLIAQGWTYLGYIRAGSYGYHAFQMTITTGISCVYPPRTRIDTVTCYISSTVELHQKAPTSRLVASKTQRSGYWEGSSDYNACVNSNTRVSFGSGLPAYGFYEIGTSSRLQNVSVEVALEPHPLTGVWEAPKIIGHAPAYSTGLRIGSTASLHCSVGFQSPGVWQTDWTDAPCVNVSYFCPVVDPLIEVSDPNASRQSWKRWNGTLQLMRDGKTRELVFGLGTINGPSVTVHDHQTRFLRSGTPWDGGKSYSKNLFELRTDNKGGSMLSGVNGGNTPWLNGKINSTFVRGYYSSEYDRPTVLTQEVRWTGTRTVRSGVVNSIDPVSGAVDYRANFITVPTSGLCSQSTALDFVRPIGHESGY